MLRYLYKLALPGGRRVVVAYYPPKPQEPDLRRIPEVKAPEYDRIFAQAGLFTRPLSGQISTRGKRTR